MNLACSLLSSVPQVYFIYISSCVQVLVYWTSTRAWGRATNSWVSITHSKICMNSVGIIYRCFFFLNSFRNMVPATKLRDGTKMSLSVSEGHMDTLWLLWVHAYWFCVIVGFSAYCYAALVCLSMMLCSVHEEKDHIQLFSSVGHLLHPHCKRFHFFCPYLTFLCNRIYLLNVLA